MKREKTGGRNPGTPNKLTGQAKEIFNEVMDGEITNIKAALDEVRKKDVAKYLDVVAKLLPYFMPRKLEIDDQSVNNTVTIHSYHY